MRSVAWFVTLAVVVITGCTAFVRMPAAARPPADAHDGGSMAPAPPSFLRAGTARVDITPPPGVSTFGHGPDARVSDGYWTRLYCRVFALETSHIDGRAAAPGGAECTSAGGTTVVAGGPPPECGPAMTPTTVRRFAIVPCDLAAVSGVLQRAVADRVRDVLPGSRVMLTATHTHAGPAHYFDGVAFGGGLSTHLPGFDDEMVAFLSERIAEGIRSAFARSVRATMQWTHYDPLASPPTPADDIGMGMWNLTWNRSHCAHQAFSLIPPKELGSLSAPRLAIDPSLHVLDLAEVTPAGNAGRPLGSMSFYAMHPTVLSSDNTLLGADVDGVVSRLVEREMRSEPGAWGDPLHGVVNTNEGDMSPVWHEGTKKEAVVLAGQIAERIHVMRAARNAKNWETRPLVDMRYTEFDVSYSYLSDQRSHTCRDALVGVSVDHGACDHPTTSFSSAPHWPDDTACQTAKAVPGGPFEHAFAGGQWAFPSELPLAVARVGDSLITFVPAELTVGAGRQVADAAQASYRKAAPAASGDLRHTFIAGLANEYIMYGTTRAEYAWKEPGGGCPTRDTLCRQTYEGAATLYGPSTVDLFEDRAKTVANALATGTPFPHVDEEAARKYPVGPRRERFPRDTRQPPRAAKRAAGAACVLSDGTYCARWHDDVPLRVEVAGRPWVAVRAADGTELDDTGVSFVTRVKDTDPDGASWTTAYKALPGEPALTPKWFVIHGREGDPDIFIPVAATCDGESKAQCSVFDSAPLARPSPLEQAEKKPACGKACN